MKRYGIIVLILVVLVSAGFNLYQYREIRRAETQLTIVNNRVLDNIEQYTRWSIRFIDEIQTLQQSGNADEIMNQTTFSHLQNSLEDVVEYYAYFVDLRTEQMEADRVCTETLESLRNIRNVVNHNLQDKFEINEHRFTANDYIFLQQLEDNLQDFLGNVYKIAEMNENQLIIVIPEQEKEELREISNSFRDLGARYRHSILLGNEEEMLSEEEAKSRLLQLAKHWVDTEALEEIEVEGINYRNGIGYYTFETDDLLLWLDARAGSLRYMEYAPAISEDDREEIRRQEALRIAQEFYENYQGPPFEELIHEVFTYNQEGNGEMVYAFRFIPVDSSLRLSSDVFEINVGATSGEVVRFRNQYNETSIFLDSKGTLALLELSDEEEVRPLSPETIEELHQENFGDMEYKGRAVIRNFYTEFSPKVVKVFFSEIEGQQAAIYFDEFTGHELERIYYPYESF